MSLLLDLEPFQNFGVGGWWLLRMPRPLADHLPNQAHRSGWADSRPGRYTENHKPKVNMYIEVFWKKIEMKKNQLN